MHRLIIEFCRWLQSTRLAMGILESGWVFPYVQFTHFTGLSLWVGTNLLLDLRLMGVGRKLSTLSEFCDALFVWNWVGFCVGILGGFLLFSTSTLSYIQNPAFDIKLGILIPLGLILHVTIQRKARDWSQTEEPPAIAKVAGFVEMALWLSVVSAAVLIPYFAGEP
jgi:hypothetical protein